MTRHPGVESCSSGAHVDAGHHTELAPFRKAVVSMANIVQEVKTGTNTADSDLNLRSDSPSAHGAALTPHAAAGTGFASGRFLTSAAWLLNPQ